MAFKIFTSLTLKETLSDKSLVDGRSVEIALGNDGNDQKVEKLCNFAYFLHSQVLFSITAWRGSFCVTILCLVSFEGMDLSVFCSLSSSSSFG